VQQNEELVEFSEPRRLAEAEHLPDRHAVTPHVTLLVEFTTLQRLWSTPADHTQIPAPVICLALGLRLGASEAGGHAGDLTPQLFMWGDIDMNIRLSP